MEDYTFVQNVSRKTYIKLLLVINGPICAIYFLSLFRGDNPSALNLLMVLIGINAFILGVLKWTSPRKEALKIESGRFYLSYKGKWVEVVRPHESILFYAHYVKVRFEKKLLTIHFNDSDLLKLKTFLE